MTTNILNKNGVDMDNIYQIAPSYEYSARKYIIDNGTPELGVSASNADHQVMGVDGEDLYARYLHKAYSGVSAGSENSGEIEARFNGFDSQGRLTNSFVEYVDLYDVCAKKGSAGTPSFSPSSGSFSNTRQVNNGEFDSTDFTVSTTKQASGNPPPTSYSIYSYTLSGGSNNSVLVYNGSPTVSSSGYLRVFISAAGDSFDAGSDTYTLVIKVKAHNTFGESNIYTHTLSQTITWNAGGSGGDPF